MRHSFLPTKEQAVLKKMYYYHVVIVMLFLLSVAGLIGVGSLFPAYIYVSTEAQSQSRMVSSFKKDQSNSNTIRMQKELQTDAATIRTLVGASAGFQPSDVIEQMVKVREVTRYSSIILSDMGSSTATVIVSGVAPTRESLVALRDRLEALSAGNKVDLPISGFARSKDIPFSLKVTYALK